MSVIENLENIHRTGINDFVKKQSGKYACPKCKGIISVHNKKCFECEKITKLVENET